MLTVAALVFVFVKHTQTPASKVFWYLMFSFTINSSHQFYSVDRQTCFLHFRNWFVASLAYSSTLYTYTSVMLPAPWHGDDWKEVLIQSSSTFKSHMLIYETWSFWSFASSIFDQMHRYTQSSLKEVRHMGVGVFSLVVHASKCAYILAVSLLVPQCIPVFFSCKQVIGAVVWRWLRERRRIQRRRHSRSNTRGK